MSRGASGHLWHQLGGYLMTGHRPSSVLVAGTALLALAAVGSGRIWPVTRTVVTIAHEGGHALVALLTGRRLDSVRVLRSTAGLTVSSGSPTGAGIVLTAAAGYTAPPLLGLGAAALIVSGHLFSMLLISLAALTGLAIAVRNAYGIVAILVTGAAIAAVLWRGSALAEAAFGYLMTWFLLLGGVRPVLELQRGRRRSRRPMPRRGGAGGFSSRATTDADQLAALTGMPGGLWVALFGLVALAALALGGFWLIG